jgi:hypothetical protein
MARPRRIKVAGGGCHLTSRGTIAGLPEQFATRLLACVLLANHDHLLQETAKVNLNRAMQWLHLTSTVDHNTRHQRREHLLRGHYKSVLIEDEAGVQEVVRHVHLNPVRVRAVKPGKPDRAAETARMRWAELATEPDVVCTAAGAALSRIGRRMASDAEYTGLVERLQKQLLNIEI